MQPHHRAPLPPFLLFLTPSASVSASPDRKILHRSTSIQSQQFSQVPSSMVDMESARHWFTEHKLRAVGTLWATSLLGSFAYNWSQPGMKTSVKLIHARLHAQALTLTALAGSAVVEYYDHQSGEKAKRYEKHFEASH